MAFYFMEFIGNSSVYKNETKGKKGKALCDKAFPENFVKQFLGI